MIQITPQLVTTRLVTIGSASPAIMLFVCRSISLYLSRIIASSDVKLIRYGLRPVLSPMSAKEALERVKKVRYSEAWIYALVANDNEVARLAWRAVCFYAERYSKQSLEEVKKELGAIAEVIKKAAESVNVILQLELECSA